MNETTTSPSSAPDAEAVRKHLRMVLAHGEFAASPQLAAFLTSIVERKLEGADDRIKAYAIATEALGRPASFDPQADPIVRVQARRLRQALQIYYADPVADDAIRINLQVGSYVPEFKSFIVTGPYNVEPTVAPQLRRLVIGSLTVALVALMAAVWANLPAMREAWAQYNWEKPPAESNPLGMPALRVVVADARQIPSWFSPEQFKRGLEADLAQFDEFVVQAPAGADASNPSDYDLTLDFTGGVSAVTGAARLTRGQQGQIVWASRFSVPEDAIDSYELIDPVRRLSSKLGQPYGVLYAQALAESRQNPDQACLLSGYEWYQDPDKAKIETIRKCLEDLLQRKPGNHVAYMMLGYIYVSRYRNNMGESAQGELARALNMAKRAVALRPESAGVHQGMMEVQWARRKFDVALDAGRKAVGLNGNSSDVVADYGCRLIYSGRYSEGSTYVERAAQWLEQPPVWHEFCRFVSDLNSGQVAAANMVADRLDGQQGPEALIPVIIAAHARGDAAHAKASIASLLQYDPDYASDPVAAAGKIGLFPEVAQPLVDALYAAGLPPPK